MCVDWKQMRKLLGRAAALAPAVLPAVVVGHPDPSSLSPDQFLDFIIVSAPSQLAWLWHYGLSGSSLIKTLKFQCPHTK